MSDPNTLNSKFEIPGILHFEPGEGGLTRIAVTTPLAQAYIYLHGAHVTHFRPQGQEPLLFVSRQSHFAPDKPIRGGIPLIFPWFGPYTSDPSAPAHGFVRTLPWDVRQVQQTGDAVTITLALEPSDTTRRWLAQDFALLYTVSVGTTLRLSLEVQNRSSASLPFEEAFHTYFAVRDVRQVAIEGLSGRTYIDKTAGMQRQTQSGPIRIESETDRVYLSTPDTVTATDPTLARRIMLATQGSASTVIWNPWIDKARAMADFGDDEWPHMLCMETANVADNAVNLAAGRSHTMSAAISVAAC